MKDIQEVRACLSAWLTAFNAKDVEALMSHYDPDSVYAGAQTPLVRGTERIRACYERAFPEVKGTLKFKEEGSFEQGGMALIFGKFYFEPGGAAADPGTTGRVGLVYRRGADGRWKLLFDMDNSPPDVIAGDFL